MNLLNLEDRVQFERMMAEFYEPLGLIHFLVIGLNSETEVISNIVGPWMDPANLAVFLRELSDHMIETDPQQIILKGDGIPKPNKTVNDARLTEAENLLRRIVTSTTDIVFQALISDYFKKYPRHHNMKMDTGRYFDDKRT